MFGVKTTIKGFSGRDVTPIEDAIASVLRGADPPWSIALIVGQDGTWKLFGRPADGQGVSVDLADDERTPEAIREIVFGWYEHYRKAQLQ
jgi:hypothetical protein